MAGDCGRGGDNGNAMSRRGTAMAATRVIGRGGWKRGGEGGGGIGASAVTICRGSTVRWSGKLQACSCRAAGIW